MLTHLFENLGCFRGVLALHSNAMAVFVEQNRKRDARYGKEARNRARPVKPELVIHLYGEEREGGAEDRSHHRVGRHDGGGEDDI